MAALLRRSWSELTREVLIDGETLVLRELRELRETLTQTLSIVLVTQNEWCPPHIDDLGEWFFAGS